MINQKQVNILIGVVYRHPRRTSDSHFTMHLEATLSGLRREHKNIILVGNFNYCLLNYNTDRNIKLFVDTLYNHFFQPCITEPTRIIKNQKPSIVDNIFTNILNKDILSGNIKAKITDHLPNFIIINNIISRPKRQKVTKRDYSNFVEEIYLRDIASITVDHIINLQDVDYIYNEFHIQFNSIIQKHALLKTYSNRESKLMKLPWLTEGIQKSMKIRNSLYNRYLNCHDNFWYICQIQTI